MKKQRLPLFIGLSLGLIAPIYAGSIQVTTTEDDGNQNGQCSLREAVTEANNASKASDALIEINDLNSSLDTVEVRIREFNLSEIHGEPTVLCNENAQAVKDDNDEIGTAIEQTLFGSPSDPEDSGLCGTLINLETEINELNTLIEDIENLPQDCEGAEGVLDSILLTAGETYTLDPELGEIVIEASTSIATQNYLNEDGNFAVIDAQGNSRIFFQQDAESGITLSGVILTGGHAAHPYIGEDVTTVTETETGTVTVSVTEDGTSTTTVTDEGSNTISEYYDSSLGFGGAIFTHGILNLEDTIIQNSSAYFSGGAVAIGSDGRGNFNNADFIKNSARENGGAVTAEGDLLISSSNNDDNEANLYQENSAGKLGGAIFFSGEQITIDESRIGTLGKGNSAVNGGGGVAVIDAFYEKDIFVDIQRSSFLDNKATGANSIGGGITLIGNLDLTIENSTFAKNQATTQGGGLFIDNPASTQKFNNLTIVENSANTAGGIIQVNVGTTPSASFDIFNSVIAFNDSIDCLFEYNSNLLTETVTVTNEGTSTTTITIADPQIQIVNNVFGGLNDCEVPFFVTQQSNKETGNNTLTDFFEPPFNDIDNGYIPKPVEGNAVDTRVFNAGSAETSVFSCKAIDQRTESRYNSIDSNCDIGAIEYQAPGATEDVYTGLIQGGSYCLGIVENDVKDGAFAFTTIDEVNASLSIRSEPDAGGKAEIITECPEGAIAQDDFLNQDLDGDGIVDASQENSSVLAVGILYTAPDIFGQEKLVYQIVMPDGDIQSAQALLNINPGAEEFGNYSRGTITGFGSFGGLMIGLLAVLSLARFKKYLALGLAFLSSQVWSATIIVDTCIDPYDAINKETPIAAFSDGVCSLREAILSSRNNQVNLSDDCEDGEDTSRDRIILKELTEDDSAFASCEGKDYVIKGTLDIFSRTIFECEGYENKSFDELCTIKADSSISDGFRLINSRGDLQITGINFEGGTAESAGGAILSEASLELVQSAFRNNTATQGGAVMLSGISSNFTARDIIFENNLATTTDSASGGGAIASSALNEHYIDIARASFINNTSNGSGGALFLAGVEDELSIINSTFYQNSASAAGGAMHIANLPSSVLIQNASFVDNSAANANSIFGLDESTREKTVILTNTVFASDGVNCESNSPASTPNRTEAYNRVSDETCIANVVFEEVEPEEVANPGEQPTNPTDEELNDYNDALNAYNDYLAELAVFETAQERFSITNISDLNQGFVFNDELAMPVLIPTHAQVNNQNTDTVTPFACEDADQLELDRDAGGACDIGALEKQELTAIDDFPGRNFRNESRSVPSNTYDNPDSCRFLALDKDPTLNVDATADYTTGRSVIIDVLGNDIPDLVTGINSESVTVQNGVNATLHSIDDPVLFDFLVAPSEQEIYSNSDLEECLADRKANFSDFVVLFNNPERSVGIETFTYTVATADGSATDSAVVELNIQNIAPLARDDHFKINANNGLVKELNLIANDTDDDSTTDEIINLAQCESFGFTRDDVSTSNTDLNEFMNRFYDEDQRNREVILSEDTIYFYNDLGDDLLKFTATDNDTLLAQLELVKERLIEKLVINQNPVFGSLALDPKTCGVNYEVSSVFQVADDSFFYQIADYENDDSLSQIELSNIAQVNITMTGPGTQDAVNSLPNSLTKAGSFDYFSLLGLGVFLSIITLRTRTRSKKQ